MAQFSDPAWWPKPPPKPPVHISLPRIILGGILPVGLVAVVATLIVTQHGHHARTARSVAAYESCLSSHGAGTAAERAASPSFQARRACAALLPQGTAVGTISPASAPNSAQARFEACVRGALGNLPHRGSGGGGFERGPSSALRAAESVCQSLAGEPAGSGAPRPGNTAVPPAGAAAAPKA